MRMRKFRPDCERISYYFKWIFLLAKVQIRARVTFFVGGRFIDATENSTPVKNLLRWKMLQIYDIFFSFLAKTRKSFLASLSNFFLVNREMWQMVLLLFRSYRLVRNDLQCFWDFLKDREKFETFFRLPRSLPNLNGKYFSSIEKQFFNQTQELKGSK